MLQNPLPKKYTEFLSLGAEIAASLIIPILVGYYLDEYFNTSPRLTLAGVLLAMISFGFMIMRINKKLNNSDKN